MKKLMMLLAIGIGFSVATANARTAGVTPAQQQVHKTKATTATAPAKANNKAKPATAAKPAKPVKATPAKTNSNGTVLKKDGTPDRRYKEAEMVTGPKKADGTPDMRYQSNKKPQEAKK